MRQAFTSTLVAIVLLAQVIAVYPQKQRPGGPLEIAQTLYGAWQSGNRAKANTVAEATAVKKLFGVRRRTMEFKGCYEREEGDVECVFDDSRHDLRLAMLINKFDQHHRVTSLSFSTEAQ